METTVKKARKLVHDLSNRMLVIQKAFEIFAKHLPSHRLTELGANSLERAVDNIKELKQVLAEIESPESQEQEVPANSGDSVQEIFDYILSQKPVYEEMCVMSVTVDSSNITSTHTTVKKEDISKAIELYLEATALSASNELIINIQGTQKLLRVSLSDNGDGELKQTNESILKIIELLESSKVKVKLNSIKDIGSTLLIDAPLS